MACVCPSNIVRPVDLYPHILDFSDYPCPDLTLDAFGHKIRRRSVGDTSVYQPLVKKLVAGTQDAVDPPVQFRDVGPPTPPPTREVLGHNVSPHQLRTPLILHRFVFKIKKII